MRPLIIGHRGFLARHPDNSLAGVKAAIHLGADGVEVDVRVCADGVWVCHHDRSRRRRAIEEWSLADLVKEGVSTLTEVVAAVPRTRWIYVEIKPLANEVLRRHLEDLIGLIGMRSTTTRVISSSLSVLREIQGRRECFPVSWVIDRVPLEIPAGIDLSPKHTLVEKLVSTGRFLHPWTVNRASRINELVNLGVASITTNRPDLALETLNG